MSERESVRLELQAMIGRAWLRVHNTANDNDLTPEFREELRQCASLLHQAERCIWARPVVPWEPVAGKPEVFFPGEVNCDYF